MFDVVLENSALEEALALIEGFDEAMREFLAEHDSKDLRAARRLYKETVEAVARERELGDDARIRCGAFVITTRARAGGGFEVPVWSKVLPGSFTRAF